MHNKIWIYSVFMIQIHRPWTLPLIINNAVAVILRISILSSVTRSEPILEQRSDYTTYSGNFIFTTYELMNDGGGSGRVGDRKPVSLPPSNTISEQCQSFVQHFSKHISHTQSGTYIFHAHRNMLIKRNTYTYIYVCIYVCMRM